MRKKLLFVFVIILALGASAFALLSRKDSGTKSTSQNQKPLYVALGDSVAAGMGLARGVDTSGCGRTAEAYPNRVAEAGGYELKNIACVGATTQRGLLGVQKLSVTDIKAQLKQLKEIPKPALITITIGANDLGWAQSVASCFIGECGSDTDTSAIATKIQSTQADMKRIFDELQTLYPESPPKIVVTDYYQVINESETSCSQLAGISDAEAAWIKSQVQVFNASIDAVAKDYSFIKIVPLDFKDHGQCSSDSWVQGLQALAPLHPTASGQQAIADAVLEAIKE